MLSRLYSLSSASLILFYMLQYANTTQQAYIATYNESRYAKLASAKSVLELEDHVTAALARANSTTSGNGELI
jgi:hypothetical protein